MDDLLGLGSEEAEGFSYSIELDNNCCWHPLRLEKNSNIYLASCHGNIEGNKTLLYRVLLNLIENVVKFNGHNGTVTVSMNSHDEVMKITGIGMP